MLLLGALSACAGQDEQGTGDATPQPDGDAEDGAPVEDPRHLPGDPTDPATRSITDLAYEARPEDYAREHPRFGGAVGLRIAIVVPRLDATVAQINALLDRHDAAIVGALAGFEGEIAGMLVLRLPTDSHEALDAVMAELEADPAVELAVHDVLLEPDRISRWNGGSPLSWGWAPGLFDGNWGLKALRVPQTWNLLEWIERENHAKTDVAVLDAGFAPSHVDLPFTPDQRPEDVGDHGTHVGGIIAATFDNGLGVDGIDPRAQLSLTVARSTIQGLLDLVQRHPDLDVINISLGYGFCKVLPSDGCSHLDNWNTDSAHQALAARHGRMVREGMRNLARRRGGSLPFIAVSAGNGSNGPNGPQPAQYNSPYCNAALQQSTSNIVAVEAVDRTGQRAAFSNVGGHISAPGTQILSTVLGDGYDLMQGTSMASPMVAGAASFVFELDPGFPRPTLASNDLLALLKRYAVPVTGGASNRIDLWPAAMELDGTLEALCDIDDGTPDGNDRTTSDDARGDGVVDMSDFRRFRDWLLFVGQSPSLAFDDPAHAKLDANGDGEVRPLSGVESLAGSGVKPYPGEATYPRGDFNGDGTLSQFARSAVPDGAAPGSTLSATDLEVFKWFFQDEHYFADELDSLLVSGDLIVSAEACFRESPNIAEVLVEVTTPSGLEMRRLTRDAPRGIYTLPVGTYTAAMQMEDLLFEEQLDIGLGADQTWEPTCDAAGRAPVVRAIRFTTPVRPGEPAKLEVDVFDPEGVADLAGTTTVTVTSDVLEFSPHVFGAADGTAITGNMVRFAGNVDILRALSDRSNCPFVTTYEASASAVDDVAFPPDRAPDANAGPTFRVDDIVVANIDPVVACDHDDQTVIEVAPGATFTFEVAVADANHDAIALCDELPIENVAIDGTDGPSLDTAPDMLDAGFDGAARDFGPPGTNGVTRFTVETLTLATPHADPDEPTLIRFTAADDKGRLLTADPNPDCPADTPDAIVRVRVRNVEPVVVSGRARPEALRPGATIEAQFTVVVDDANTVADVVAVDLDLTELGAGVVPLLRLADGKTWQRVVAVRAPAEQGTKTAWAQARDDDGAVSARFAIVMPIANLPPVWGGGGWAYEVNPDRPPSAWDGFGSEVVECTPIRFGAIFTDANRDALDVVCILEGNGPPRELKMTRTTPGSNVYVAATTAPPAGEYTVSFRATEVGVPPPPLTTLHPFGPLTVRPAPGGCERPQVACLPGGVVEPLALDALSAGLASDGHVAFVTGDAGASDALSIHVRDACRGLDHTLELPPAARVAGAPEVTSASVYWSDDRVGPGDYRLWRWDFQDGAAEPARVVAGETVQRTPRLGQDVVAWIEDGALGRVVMVLELETGAVVPLSEPLAPDLEVRFDASAGRVVWLDDDGGVHMADAPGWTATVLELTRPPDDPVAIALDGDRLAFDDVDPDTGRSEIFVADLATGEVTRLGPGAAGRTRPDISGARVVFEELVALPGSGPRIMLSEVDVAPLAFDLSRGSGPAHTPRIAGDYVSWLGGGDGGDAGASVLVPDLTAICPEGNGEPCVSDADCDDDLDCTDDTCSGPTCGTCVHAQLDCDDGIACTADRCNESAASGVDPCLHEPQQQLCAASNRCFESACDALTGCEETPVVCDDDNLCTVDNACSPAVGCSFTTVVCPTPPVCKRALCNPATGCGTENLTNGTVCPGGTCQGGQCVAPMVLALPDCWLELTPGASVATGGWYTGGAGTPVVSLTGGTPGYASTFSVNGQNLVVGPQAPKGYRGDVGARVRIQRGADALSVLVVAHFDGPVGQALSASLTGFDPTTGPTASIGDVPTIGADGAVFSAAIKGNGAGWVCDASSCGWCWAARTSIATTIAGLVIGSTCNPACGANQVCLLDNGTPVCKGTSAALTASCDAQGTGNLYVTGSGCVWRSVTLGATFAAEPASSSPGTHAANIGTPFTIGPVPAQTSCGFIAIEYAFTASPPLACAQRLQANGSDVLGLHVFTVLTPD